jgi:hypothetical protein
MHPQSHRTNSISHGRRTQGVGLANDLQMKSVWLQLKNRPGLDRLFWFVWGLANEELRETTQKENELQLKLVQHEIDILRVVAARMVKEDENEFLRLARVDGDILSLPGEIGARQLIRHHQIAVIREVAADRAAELPLLRGPGDPLTRSYGRDPQNKTPSVNREPGILGTAKNIANFLNENCRAPKSPAKAAPKNSPMYGTAQTLTKIVLGLSDNEVPTKSAIRVAFEKDRCAQSR